MMTRCATVCLAALALLCLPCDAKSIHQGQIRQDPQTKYTFEEPFTWVYPTTYEEVTPTPKSEEIETPVPANSVTAICAESSLVVTVEKDFFKNGQIIKTTELTLGDCKGPSDDTLAYVFDVELQHCEHTSTVVEDALVYSYKLYYKPEPVGNTGVVRTNEAVVYVDCYYPRYHNVTSGPLQPLWTPFSTVREFEEKLYFTLRLRTSDWRFDRLENQYFLGDIIRFEVSVKQYFHGPLRVYVDRCAASASQSNSDTEYVLIEDGCLVDAIKTGSLSKFVERSYENILRFEVEAFAIQETAESVLYITCNLRASTTEQAIDEGHRACSYENNRWVEASGAHGACDSCPAPSGVSYTGGSSATGSGVSYSPGFGQQKTKQQRNQGQRQGRYRRDLAAGGDSKVQLTIGPFTIRDRPSL